MPKATTRRTPKRLPAKRRARPTHPALRYIDDVLTGRVVVNKWIRLAVERHVRDLKEGPARGLTFDATAAQHVIDFYAFTNHSKGEWAGKPFTPEPWQQFVDWVTFGWKKADGTRRFRVSYLEVARKNGKSTKAAADAIYLMLADGESGAEVYSVATKKDQAKIVWEEAARMVRASPALRARIGVLRNNMHVLAKHSKYEPLSSDEDTLDGLNPSAAIADEIHAWKTRGLWDVLETGTGARRQPLLLPITTAGSDKKSVCYELHSYGKKVLEGLVEDDSFAAFIYAIDADDRWDDERVWIKANPSLGITVKLDDLRRKCLKAKEMPAAQNAFRRLHLNEWTEQDVRWLDLDVWDENGHDVDPAMLEGRRCYAAFDLSSVTDLSARGLLFPPTDDDELWYVLMKFYVPAENVQKRVKKDGVPYDRWIEEGYITATEGDVVDYDVIRNDLRADGEHYEIVEIAFDRWNATQLSTQLAGDGFTMVKFGQGYHDMASPSRELEKLLAARVLAHGKNPVLRWMAGNVTAEMDAAGNRKPSKAKSTERIDGIVALVMTLGRAIVAEVQGPSVYEERGLLTLGGDD
ncbi:MAG: terminase large subunit [Thermoanaerobaculia bacterium]